MHKWRSLAIQLFPGMRSMYEQEDESIWDVLFDLLPDAVDAHRAQNTEKLKRIYTFTRWCHQQKDVEPGIWEAACVAFYEHLIDDEITLKAIPYWVKPETFEDLLPVFESRLGQEEYRDLLTEYNRVNGTGLG